MEEFKDYLIRKKIDPARFQQEEPGQWQEFKTLFEQMHPESFTAQKLFLINAIRRRFPLSAAQTDEAQPQVKTKPKIKIPPRKPKNS